MDSNKKNAADWVDERLASLNSEDGWTPDTNSALDRMRDRRSVRPRRRTWTWLAAAGATASVCAMTLPAPRLFAQRCIDCSVALWQTIAPVRAAVKSQTERKAAPDFTLSDADGKPIRLSAYKGKVVLLDFWATWCGGCKVEIPWYMDFQQTYRDRGLVVLGVSLDEDGWKVVRPFIAAKKINYPVMIGNPKVAALYGAAEALPVTLLIDKSGRIASKHVGLGKREEFQSEIEALLR